MAEDTTLISFLQNGFPVGYKGPVPTPADPNLASAIQHPRNVTIYVLTELEEGAMVGPFDMEPFIPWCQVNALITRPKKESYLWTVIMALSWPHTPGVSVNACTPTDR